MKYRKKPVVIEAKQFFPKKKPWPRGVKQGEDRLGRVIYSIETLKGEHFVSPGDFIITGVKGERYACKPDIFEMTYEKV